MNNTNTVSHNEYMQEILSTCDNVDFYQVKKYLEINNIEIIDIFLEYDKKYSEMQVLKCDIDSQLRATLYINKKSWVYNLPSIYQKNKNLINFLKGFEIVSLVHKVEIDYIEDNFIIEKSKFIDWLASWFGIGFSLLLTNDKKRKLTYQLIDLYKIRGTQKYLETMIAFLYDIDNFEIKTRYVPKSYLDDYDNDLININTSFTVKINDSLSENDEEEKLKLKSLKNFIYKEKPAFTTAYFEYKNFIDRDKYKEEIIEYEEIEENIIEYHQEEEYEEEIVEYEEIEENIEYEDIDEENIEYED
jgi:phage tail-like protein